MRCVSQHGVDGVGHVGACTERDTLRERDSGPRVVCGRERCSCTLDDLSEARVVDGEVQGLVVIWPVMDEDEQPRVAAEAIDSIASTAALPAAAEGLSDAAAPAAAAPDSEEAQAPAN